MKHSFLAGLTFGLVATVIVLVVLLNLTNPTSAGSVGVLLVFADIYLITFFATLLLVQLFRIFYNALRPPKKNALSGDKERVTKRRAVAVAAILDFIPIFFISMSSIKRLNLMSVLLLLALETVSVFYVWHRF